MTPGIRPLVAGNWKMNGTGASLNELMMIGNGFMGGLDAETEALVCVPATLLTRAAEVLHAQEWDYFPGPARVGRALLETVEA